MIQGQKLPKNEPVDRCPPVKGTFFVGIENTKGNGKSSLFGGTGVGIKIVKERIEIFNVTYGKKLFYHGNLLPIHCNIGYRCELEIVLK